MAMPAAKGLFHRAIVQSGPFLKSLSPAYSGRLAELVLAELGLSKSRVRELQAIPVDRLLGAAAEAMTGNPNYADLPHWPKYTSEHRATMQFDRQCEVRNGPESLGLRLIAESRKR